MATQNKNLSVYDKSKLPDALNYRFGIVVSDWNSNITEELYKGLSETLLDCGVNESNIDRVDVPGSFELIYAAKKMQELNYDAIVVVGCVIQGQTKHFDFVCQGVTQGVKDLNITGNTPVIFCVLTDNNMQQSVDRSGGKLGNKGVEAAITAIKMADLKYSFKN
jgi:6,7-dimethyl-8-ribityllumazine synthase